MSPTSKPASHRGPRTEPTKVSGTSGNAEEQQKEVRAQGRKPIIHMGWREKQREIDEAAKKLKEEEKIKEDQHRSDQKPT